MVCLELCEVSLGYGSRVVLSGISMHVVPGGMVGIVGPNSSGKSTLIKGISRLIAPKSGRILIDGRDVATIKRGELARTVAVVPQDPVLPDAFLALEVVLMGRTPHLGLFRYEGARDMAIVSHAMEVTDTLALGERRVGELSGGERQRLVVARALAQEPQLILLDEPTAHLDINYQVGTLDMIKSLCSEQGLTAVAALHDLNLASQYCDRLIMLSEGGIYAEGPPKDVITARNIKDVYGAEVCVYPHPLNDLPATLIVPGDGGSPHGGGAATTE